MSKINVYLLAFLISLTCLNVYSQELNTSEGSTFNHTVESGQTVYAIATMYGVTVDDIYRLNPGSKESIRSGQTLQVPQPQTISSPVTPNDTDGDYTFHTIQPKETLYSLTVKYALPASAILEANPGLSVETFQSGKTIRIPVNRLENIPQSEFRTVVRWVDYRVPAKETLYNIGRKYNIPTDELIQANPQLKNGVKEGMVIKVPVQTDEPVTNGQTAPRERDVNALLNQRVSVDRVNMVKVALLLPLTTNRGNPEPKFVEYYEGFLLAVDSLKAKGVSIEVSVFDIKEGTAQLDNILHQQMPRDVNLIIGGMTNEQISVIGNFAKTNEIKYVVPFSPRNDEVYSNAFIFQINTPPSYQYAKAARAGAEMFANHNVIILNVDDKDTKAEFIAAFRTELQQRNTSFTEVTYDPGSFVNDINNRLSKEKRNLIVPTSSSKEALDKFRAALRGFIDNNPNYANSVTLFGYPDWQTYLADSLDDFYALDTYIYTSFYADNLSPAINNFYRKYRLWYSKIPINSYPKFCILGFDTGMFFMDAIHTQGTNFENNLNRIRYNSLQTGFSFERANNWGGFINTNLFIVHYNKLDYSITRREIK